MASFDAKDSAILSTVHGLNDLARSATASANASLAALGAATAALPLSVISTDIGASVSTSWSATIGGVGTIEEPSYIGDVLANLPNAPTVPDVTVTISAFDGTAPTTPADALPTALTVPTAPSSPGEITFGDAPGAPIFGEFDATLPALAAVAPSAITDVELNITLPTAPGAPGELTFDGVSGAPTLSSVDVTLPSLTATLPEAVEDADVTITLPGVPTGGGMAEVSFGTFTSIPPIPSINPTIDVGILDAQFSFSEPSYTEQISGTVKVQLTRVLGGDLGIPSSVWSAMWTQAAGDLARQQVGRLRQARNRGAASYWALPSETVLAQSNAIADEGARSLQLDRLQKAISEATMKREDFWEAVKQGLALEQIWIGFHESMAQRALGAAEQLANTQIAVFNAQVQGYQLAVEAAKLQGTLYEIGVNATLKSQELQLRQSEIVISNNKNQIELLQAQWEGYKAQSQAAVSIVSAQTERMSATTARRQVAVQQFGEEVKAWGIASDNVTKLATLVIEQDKASVALYEAEIRGDQVGIEKARTQVELWKAEISAFQIEADATIRLATEATQRYNAATNRGQLAVQQFGEEVKAWGIEADNATKLKSLMMERDKALVALYEAEVRGEQLSIEQARIQVEKWKAEISAFQVEADTTLKLMSENTQIYNASTNREQLAIQRFAEQVKIWNGQNDAQLRKGTLDIQRAEVAAKNYATQYGAIDALANATSALINGRVAVAKLNVEKDIAGVDAEKARNAIEVEIGKLAQMAQEAKARIDVAQAQWAGGQAASMAQRIAELTTGYAQAAVSASDVYLGASTNMEISQHVSASQNSPLEWYFGWGGGDEAPTGGIA